jgi:hypothetical protein
MFENLGIHWASSVPAFLALACLPMPFLFYRFGHAIRMKCKFAAEAAQILELMRGGGGGPQKQQQRPDIAEDEAVKEADEHERMRRASRTRSATAESIHEIAELVRTRTQHEREDRARAQAIKEEASRGA